MTRRRLVNVEEHPKGSGRYRARTRIDGSLKTLVSGVPKGEADEAARAYLTIRDEGALRDGITLTQFGPGFLDRRERRGVRGIKQERDRWSLMVERDALGSFAVRTLERADLLDWLDRWAKKDEQTRRNALNLVRKALDEARDRQLCDRNVAREVKVERSGRADDEDELGGVLHPGEQEALLLVVPDGADRDAIEFALYGGLRQGSQWALRREDCHGERVLLRRHKSGRPRVLHLLPPARDALERSLARAAAIGSEYAFPAPRGGKRHYGKVPAKWAHWLGKAGVTRRVRWHDLRHTCATSLLAGWWGEPPRKWALDEVCSYMQHSSVKVTERYARKLAETELKAVAETKFPGGNGSGGNGTQALPSSTLCKTVTRRFESDPRLPINSAASAADPRPTGEHAGNIHGAPAWALALAAERVFIGARRALKVVRRRRGGRRAG